MGEDNAPNILVTNDDGIHAEGILALKRALDSVGNVIVVAPDRPRSASGHSITLHKPLRINRVRLPDGSTGYSTNGTPSDCVMLGILDIVEENVSLVVSGINRGPNLGWDLTYSGTVSAAMEGAIMGVPSLAVSVVSYDEHTSFDYAAEFSAHLAYLMLRHPLPGETLLNVNIPNLPREEISGVEVTTQGRRRYASRIDKRTDPQGRGYYWIGGEVVPEELDPGTDGRAVADGRVSVTPVHLDLTGYGALETVRGWGIGELGT